MKIGYARTSTIEQQAGFAAQIEELEAAGCEKIFQEQVSSVARRAQLDAALQFAREGDALVVTKLDRLARSVAHLGQILDELKGKGVTLSILNLGLDTGTATGKLILNVMGSIAEFEREMMLERQREGIAKARADGKYKGRKPSAKLKADEVQKLLKSGMRPADVARTLKIGRTSVYRIKDSMKAA